MEHTISESSTAIATTLYNTITPLLHIELSPEDQGCLLYLAESVAAPIYRDNSVNKVQTKRLLQFVPRIALNGTTTFRHIHLEDTSATAGEIKQLYPSIKVILDTVYKRIPYTLEPLKDRLPLIEIALAVHDPSPSGILRLHKLLSMGVSLVDALFLLYWGLVKKQAKTITLKQKPHYVHITTHEIVHKTLLCRGVASFFRPELLGTLPVVTSIDYSKKTTTQRYAMHFPLVIYMEYNNGWVFVIRRGLNSTLVRLVDAIAVMDTLVLNGWIATSGRFYKNVDVLEEKRVDLARMIGIKLSVIHSHLFALSPPYIPSTIGFKEEQYNIQYYVGDETEKLLHTAIATKDRHRLKLVMVLLNVYNYYNDVYTLEQLVAIIENTYKLEYRDKRIFLDKPRTRITCVPADT